MTARFVRYYHCSVIVQNWQDCSVMYRIGKQAFNQQCNWHALTRQLYISALFGTFTNCVSTTEVRHGR
jgi:hypothetical protein